MLNKRVKMPAWQKLVHHQKALADCSVADFFAQDPARFEDFHLELDGLLYDYSKQRLKRETLSLLCDLARDCEVEGWRAKMFKGDKINLSESRAVLHTALRVPAGSDALVVDGENVIPAIHETLHRMKVFSGAVRDGVWTGHSGRPVTDIVNIGIGGSDLGPRLVCGALGAYGAREDLRLHFVSNVDGAQIERVLAGLNPHSSLFVVASKTMTTQETMTNAATAKDWLVAELGDEKSVASHFVAISTNIEAACAFGIARDNIFGFRDWVGGRFSLWSPIGLPIALAVGFENFRRLLDGAHAMDRHFYDMPLEKNMPALMALIGIWNRNFWDCGALAVIPYDLRLALLPAYLQQLEMESNGKQTTRDGQAITDYQTAPVLFGQAGTDCQHSFFQKIHQGTDVVPVDFIGCVRPEHKLPQHHHLLLSNMAAQGQALMQGQTQDQAGGNPHGVFSGSRPCSTLLLERLDPFTLGQLIALYEHKTFVQGVIWGVNSFDQYGVELGKKLAKRILAQDAAGAVTGGPSPQDTSAIDSSTKAILARIGKKG